MHIAYCTAQLKGTVSDILSDLPLKEGHLMNSQNVVNRTLPSLHGGSLETTLSVPFRQTDKIHSLFRLQRLRD